MNVKRNRLDSEKSPYLQQHKDNPVHWYAWGDEAFRAAQAEDKPVFLSIGYSTCYWCHVMEKDSFENNEAADVLNEHFISIKVDREERPDLDQIYMDAVAALSGRGGWPLSVFLTADRRPFFGFTFLPRNQFIDVLARVNQLWTEKRSEVEKAACELLGAVRAEFQAPEVKKLGGNSLQRACQALTEAFDAEDGGFSAAPKFPPAMPLALLLRLAVRRQRSDLQHMAVLTLEKMARGGIFDHLGGGFHRYSTDKQWLVPHFEKMLYDNALLAHVYLEAFQVVSKPLFGETARLVLDYTLRDMRDEQGAFFSAEDAGEVKREGEYYVWTTEELKTLLAAEDYRILADAFTVSEEGNFEYHTNVLSLRDDSSWSSKGKEPLRGILRRLEQERQKRERPRRDEKIIVSWNALMISALCKGWQVLGEKRYLKAAQEAGDFIVENLASPSGLLRRYCGAEAMFSACLDDYAYLVQALLDLYESSFQLSWFAWARDLQAEQDSRFWDSENGGYFFTQSKDAAELARKKDWFDGATPSANGVSALNLLRLYHFTFAPQFKDRAEHILKTASSLAAIHPAALCSSLIALDFYLDQVKEIVVAGDLESEAMQEFLRRVYARLLPGKVLGAAPPESGSVKIPALLQGKFSADRDFAVFVCQDNRCLSPALDLPQALRLLAS